jgi:aminoglycoside phosphotransferase (APT) family kinase protein
MTTTGRDVLATGGFVLTAQSAVPYLVDRGIVRAGSGAAVAELAGGVSSTVVAVRAADVRLVVKQALPRLKVTDDWRAKQERTELEAAALQLCDRLTPGQVPRVVDSDPEAHVLVMELLPDDARNWQEEIALGRAHADAGEWAGRTLGIWHARTAGDPAVAKAFADHVPFEQLRLSPFYETVAERLPEAAAHVMPRLEELRSRRCFVDGDFAMKNILIAPRRNWVLDFEVAHCGNPVFDLGFFLSFAVLSAIRWPELEQTMRALADAFVGAYAAVAGKELLGGDADLTAHTGCLVLARTDGKSPAQFLDPQARRAARVAGLALLRTPELGLWQWT